MVKWLATLTPIALAGCMTGTTLLGSEVVTANYRTDTATFGTTDGPVQVDFRYRIYESGGFTALCMVGIGQSSLAQSDLFHLWFKEATLTIEGDEFGKGDFVRLVKPDPANRPPQAQCARSQLAWKSGYARGRLNVQGGQVRIVY